MVKKFMLYMIAAATAVLLIGGCSNEASKQKNEYDDAINQVIKLKNEELQRPGVEKDIDKLKRNATKIEVFNEGKYIRLTFEIRKNEFAKPVFEKGERGTYSRTSSTLVKDKKPTYVENKDIGSE
ncbi:cystatin-like fold lipoprotein [Priestia megaterium]|uniref:cystatin-like fold lipoprotein n=1 Tax=Priestia megaterium TaxID=1404 RepID=UPI003672357E